MKVAELCGQPWLVNAVAREITDKNERGILLPELIIAAHVEVAEERLILARAECLSAAYGGL